MPLKSPKVFITGDVIQEFKPIAHIVNNEFKGDFCDNCLKPSTNLKKCKACLQMNYCDKQCQKQDWKSYHKYECGYMSDNNYVFLMSLSTSKLLALRFYLRYQRCPEFSSQVIQLLDESNITINDIKINKKIFRQQFSRNIMFNGIQNILRLIGIQCDRKSLVKSVALVCMNPSLVNLICYDNGIVFTFGFAFCPQLSSLSHSCLPNSAVVNNGLSIELRALKDIDVGEEITVSYISLERNKPMRHFILDKKFGFNGCKCPKCEQHLDININYSIIDEIIIEEVRDTVSRLKSRSPIKILSDRLISLYSRIYGNYHPLLTLSLLDHIIYIHFWAKIYEIPNSRLMPLIMDYHQMVIRHTRVTHGVDHPLNHIFLRNIQKFQFIYNMIA